MDAHAQLRHFIAECLTHELGATTGVAKIGTRYDTWASANGYRRLTRRELWRTLGDLDVQSFRIGGGGYRVHHWRLRD